MVCHAARIAYPVQGKPGDALKSNQGLKPSHVMPRNRKHLGLLASTPLISRSGWASSPPIHQMEDRQNRVAIQHSRPSVRHDRPYLLSQGRLVAMDGAFCTRRLVDTVRAPLEALHRVLQQISALLTQPLCRHMLFAAVDANHRFNGLLLPCPAGVRVILTHSPS